MNYELAARGSVVVFSIQNKLYEHAEGVSVYLIRSVTRLIIL